MPKPGSATETPATNDNDSAALTAKLLIIAAVTTVVGFAALFATWMQASIDPGAATLQIAAKQYALAHFTTAANLAEQVVLSEDAAAELELLKEYLIGAGRASDALPLSNIKDRRAALHIAIPHLLTASTSWPSGREDEGDRLLGLALFHIGDYAGAIARLRTCVDRNPTFREELIPVIARCYLYGEKEAVMEAVALLKTVDSQRLSPAALRDEFECLLAECLIRIGQYSDARKLLQDINVRVSSRLLKADAETYNRLAKVELLLSIADISEAIDKYGKGKSGNVTARPEVSRFLAAAMERLGRLRRDASPDLANQASLWAARGFGCSGQPAEALTLLTSVRQQQPFEGASIAAGIEEIEWLVEAGNGEESLQTVRYLLREIGNEQNFDGTAIDLQSFRSRMITALQRLRDWERFDQCIAIAKTLPSLFPAADAIYEEAITHQQAADKLLASARRPAGDIESQGLAAAKRRYRDAGDAFAESAKLRFDTKSYCETLWQSIEAYQVSGQLARCVDLLDDYLQFEDRRRQPPGLLALGKARMATGDPNGALLPLEECIAEFPRDPLKYDARLTAALAHAEAERFPKAKELLEQNLTDGSLTPASPVWRASLFTLGELLFQNANEVHLNWDLARKSPLRGDLPSRTLLRDSQPQIEEAILRLQEAATRYWPMPEAKHAAYLNARAHRLAAVWLQLETDSGDILDAAKRQFRLQSDQHLTAALAGFVNLRRDLATREEEQPLSESQQAMLRNCYIAEADTLFELGRFEQSADAFRAVSLRYMNEPPALEAMLGQSRCLKQLNRTREARLVIRQAAIVLGRIPPESDDQFLQTTRYDRKRWKELLAWLDTGPLPEETDA